MIEYCSHCNHEIPARSPEDYGYGILCRHCGKPYNLFPDSQVWLELPDGKRIGVAVVGGADVVGLARMVWKLLK